MIWKATTLNGQYEVSSTGLVKNTKTGRILKPWKNQGYNHINLGNKIRSSVHRLVALAFLPEIEGKDIVNHKNGIRDDNRVENLEWCDKSYNFYHAVEIGLCDGHPNIGHKNSVGSKNTRARLKEKDIKQIRKLRDDGLTLKQIGDIFNVHFATIGYIIQGKTWGHVT